MRTFGRRAANPCTLGAYRFDVLRKHNRLQRRQRLHVRSDAFAHSLAGAYFYDPLRER
jgi:hypothetical protein